MAISTYRVLSRETFSHQGSTHIRKNALREYLLMHILALGFFTVIMIVTQLAKRTNELSVVQIVQIFYNIDKYLKYNNKIILNEKFKIITISSR